MIAGMKDMDELIEAVSHQLWRIKKDAKTFFLKKRIVMKIFV